PHPYTLPLHDALPISLSRSLRLNGLDELRRPGRNDHNYDGFRILSQRSVRSSAVVSSTRVATVQTCPAGSMIQPIRSPQNCVFRSEEHTSELQSPDHL